MSADDDDSESASEASKSYNFIVRFIIFAFIAGPASVFGFGYYGRVGVQNSITAAEQGNYGPMLILVLWLGGLVSTAILVFKR